MIKYVVAFVLGLAAGAAAFLALLYFNPFTTKYTLSPLSLSEHEVFTLNYSAVPADTLVYTNDGESRIDPHPGKVLQLWEATIRQTTAMATVLRDSRGQPVGIGVKFASASESTNVLNGEAMVDSVWHIYMPERGTLFVQQRENYWSYLREIVIPAWWSSSDSWRGNWTSNTTAGPGALGTARVVGGSGEFAGVNAEAVESLVARAYSIEDGPVAMRGELVVEISREPQAVTQGP